LANQDFSQERKAASEHEDTGTGFACSRGKNQPWPRTAV
jgi:hypothetical protein